ncbi:MAG: glycoside hydrolase family 5 protein [Bacteroidales bacterium]|nr:glycoside hydrolase family 5 protein [Bacteroidales bacterium]
MVARPVYADLFAWLTALLVCLAVAGCIPEENGTDPVPPEPDPVETMFETAGEAVLHMGAGWNLGNTLDSNSGSLDNMWIEAWSARTPKDYETAWGQPQATRELIHMFKGAGFGAIRVPVTWYPHMGTITLYDTTKWDPATWVGTEVDKAWMARVKEVVDYVIDEGMYCILNVHHDTGASDTAWLVASDEDFAAASTRYEALWAQIATTFKDYGEKLLFESYNEMLDPYDSWCFASFATPDHYDAGVAASAYSGINKYAKLFVETVRATGGNNANRNLVINTYGACSGDGTWNTHLKEPLQQIQLPEAPGHLAVQIHSYWEADKFTSQKAEIDRLFTNINTYLQRRLGVPVIIGEWGGGTSADSNANVQFAGYFSAKAKESGVAAFYWMGLSDGKDRATPQWTMPKTKAAIMKAYSPD